MRMNAKPVTIVGIIAATWGISGLMLLLGFAVWRLTPYAIDSLQMSLNWKHWLLLIANVLFMAYSEGYKGFQKSFSPRFAARAKYLLRNTTPIRTIFSPLFCMSYFDAPKRRIIATCVLTAAIILLILSFRFIPQPWKGLLDSGVVIGLIWGMISTAFICIKAFTDVQFIWDAEVIETA